MDKINGKIFYKPDRENVFADALSRQQINALSNDQHTDHATVHSEESLTYAINKSENPVNCYRNQIIIEEAQHNKKKTFVLFKKKVRHVIQFSDQSDLFERILEVVNPSVVNAIYCDLPVLVQIQDKLIRQFPGTKFWYTKLFVIDIFDPNDQKEIIITEHNRAHRSVQENVKQVSEDYYFPKMTKLAKQIVSNCKVCSKAKYNRHSKEHIIEETQIPSYAGEILHIVIYSTDKHSFLTCIDKFSKFAIVQHIQTRPINDVKIPILQLLNIFPQTKTVFSDNEKSINSETIKTILRNSI